MAWLCREAGRADYIDRVASAPGGADVISPYGQHGRLTDDHQARSTSICDTLTAPIGPKAGSLTTAPREPKPSHGSVIGICSPSPSIAPWLVLSKAGNAPPQELIVRSARSTDLPQPGVSQTPLYAGALAGGIFGPAGVFYVPARSPFRAGASTVGVLSPRLQLEPSTFAVLKALNTHRGRIGADP